MKHTAKTSYTLLLTLFLMLALAPNAMAEERVDVGATVTLNIMTSSSTTTGIGLSVFMSFFEVVTSTNLSTSSSSRSAFASVDATQRYLDNNAVALQQDITVGGGQGIKDLAKLWQVPSTETKALGKLLQANRKALVPLLNNKVDRKTTMAFLEVIAAGLNKNATIKGATVATK